MEASVAEKFDPGWHKPETPVQALEQGLDWVTAERWAFQALIELKPEAEARLTCKEPDTWCDACGEFHEGRTRIKWDGVVCTDVKACAVGIMVIVCLDGPAVRRYFERGEHSDIEQELCLDPIGGPAMLLLGRGVQEITRSEYRDDQALTPWEPHSPEEAKSITIGFNDTLRPEFSRDQHLDRIRNAFKAAIKLGRRDEAAEEYSDA